MIINHWVPAAHRSDAVGDNARRVRDVLRRMGHTSDVYAITADDDLADDVRPFDDAGARRGDLTIFHFALASPMTEAFASLPSGRVLHYHNVTPAHFFARHDAGTFRLAALSRRELATLAGRVDLALGVSEYNRRELDRLGFPRTEVLPLAVNLRRLTEAPRCPALERALLEDEFTNILFVGRLEARKGFRYLLQAFARVKHEIPEARLLVAGAFHKEEKAPFVHLAREANIHGVHFVGWLSSDALLSFYRTATLFCAPATGLVMATVGATRSGTSTTTLADLLLPAAS